VKIGLILCADLEKAQYLYKYIELLDSVKCCYDVIYWNRNLSNYKIQCDGCLIPFNEKIDSFKPLVFKVRQYLRFFRFVHRVIKKNSYDKLIVFTTPAAIVLLDLCLNKYKKRYLFDYRDITKEYLFIYKKAVEKLANSSNMFVVSSPGYLNNFDLKKIENWVLCHNTYKDISYKKSFEKNIEEPIKIVYWGAVRQVEYNKKICKLFGNDDRFDFIFHGDGAYEELRLFCEKRKIKNITFTGKYFLNQINEFAHRTDILFNAYETDYVTTPSLAVKVYDSLVYQLPLIVSKNTFMESYLKENEHVFTFSLDDNSILDKLYEWYVHLDIEKVKKSFERLHSQVEKDEEVFKNRLFEFLIL
jgi:hypothetical protein